MWPLTSSSSRISRHRRPVARRPGRPPRSAGSRGDWRYIADSVPFSKMHAQPLLLLGLATDDFMYSVSPTSATNSMTPLRTKNAPAHDVVHAGERQQLARALAQLGVLLP